MGGRRVTGEERTRGCLLGGAVGEALDGKRQGFSDFRVKPRTVLGL